MKIPFGKPYFQVLLLLVSGRVSSNHFQADRQVYTLQLDPHSGLLDEKDLVQRLQKIQSLKPGENADRTMSLLWAG